DSAQPEENAGIVQLRAFRFDPLQTRNRGQSFLFPIPKPAELDGLIAGVQQRLRSARPASTTSAIKNDLRVLRKFAHSFFDLSDGNVDRSGNRAALFDL